MSLAIQKSGISYTYADYLTWPDEERWELVDGLAYAMSPAPSPRHQGILRELLLQIGPYLKGKPCQVFPAPFDVRLPNDEKTSQSVKTVVQPDLSIICDPAKIDDKGCFGSPDWVIEIVSPGSVQQDYVRKLNLYERHGVREYWIVHPIDRLVMVFELEQSDTYGKPAIYTDQDTITSRIFNDLPIDLKTVFS